MHATKLEPDRKIAMSKPDMFPFAVIESCARVALFVIRTCTISLATLNDYARLANKPGESTV
jgi:hypothetical protein